MKKVEICFILLGIGIGVMISGATLKMNPVPRIEYSDQEIIDRARDLGMVGIKEHIENNSEGEGASLDKSKEKTIEESPAEVLEVKIEVLRGEGSSDIAKKLIASKLIEDEVDFVNFIVEKNAGKSFREGTYMIELGSDYESILRILTKGVY